MALSTLFSHLTRPRFRRQLPSRLLVTGVATVIAVVTLLPFFWVVSTALKDREEVTVNRLGPPREIHLENFPTAWSEGNFDVYFRNSLLEVVPSVLLVLLLGLLAAYAFARFHFRGRELLFTLFLTGLTIPIGVLVIPLFYLMLDLKLLNTLWALILPQVAIGLPFAILILRTFIQELPQEILDAGRIDGCSEWQLLWRIVTPLSRPAIFALFIFNFMWNWNQFLLPVVLIQEEAKRTLPLGLNFFLGRYISDLPLLMAGATISFIPIVIVYLLLQRHFIRGITAGAIK